MTGTDWRKSSYSFANGNCVEVGRGPAAIAVRDSKNPGGPVLRFRDSGWAAFVAAVKRGPARPA